MARDYRYGQHFLRSPRVVAELIGHSNIRKNDTVVDLGAGSGVISSVLARRARQVIAVELEPEALQKLHTNLDQNETVTIVEQDIMEYELPDTLYKVFSNIPFHLSSAILHKIASSQNPPTAAYLIVQKQFANKLLPDHPGFSSQLGMLLGPRLAFKVRKRLKRTDFWPFPNVDTVLLEIKLRETPLLEKSSLPAYESFIKKHFTDPGAFARLDLQLVHRHPGIKPSSLTLTEWIALFKKHR